MADPSAVQARIIKAGLQNAVEVTDGKLSRTEASAGQRKRLALLQLMLEDRDLMLLDEVASDLDSEFKSYFYRDLLKELKDAGKTIVIATHDAEYFAYADRIICIENGQLISSKYPNQGSIEL